ncbi:hypothetical protein AB0K51_14980 [Kitasatospora sp. NPDC049285]|uniref:hypothetical protein n=1 Tax=Kitasatospora sp. NPDC049285 TaxID=3157096 RepID=UPI00343A804B
MTGTRMASEHRWIYLGAIVLLVAMVVIGLITYTQQKATNEAYKKAGQFSDKLVAAGYPAPDQKQIANTLGTNGGAVCEDPASALKTGLQRVQLSNGAGGPGQRPIIASARAIEAEALLLSVYCPDQLQKYQDKIDDFKTDDTVKN